MVLSGANTELAVKAAVGGEADMSGSKRMGR